MIGLIYKASKWSAIFGGLVLCAITVMIVASVSGRALIGLGLGPVPGDFELVEVGTAVAVFFFLPWCFLRGGHATVDLLYMHLPPLVQRVVTVISDLLMLLVWLVLTWRLWEGTLEKRAYLETTFILQMPVWWGYALCLLGAGVGCLAYLARAAVHFGLAHEPAGWATATSGGHH